MKSFIIACIMLALVPNIHASEKIICRDLLITYDVERLVEELKYVEGEYMPRSLGSDDWTAIPLRNATGTDTQEGVQLVKTLKNKKMLPCKNSSFLEKLPYISSILDNISQLFTAEIGLVRLSNVRSQKSINRHNDGPVFDIDRGSIYRLHIPILTGQDVLFEIDKNNYNLKAGTLYYTNVSLPHSVINNGPFDRIHLIIDVHASSVLEAHILQSPELDYIFFNSAKERL